MFVKLENWTTLLLLLPWGNIKNYFSYVFMVLRKRFPKASYGCKPKGATRWSSMRMNNGDLLELINITRALGKEQIWVPNSLAVCRTPVNMNSVKWPCSPWVLVLPWIERPPGVREVMGTIPVGDVRAMLLNSLFTKRDDMQTWGKLSWEWGNIWGLLSICTWLQIYHLHLLDYLEMPF